MEYSFLEKKVWIHNVQTLYLKLYLKVPYWFRENYYYDTNKQNQRHQNRTSAFDRAALYRVFARITTPHM